MKRLGIVTFNRATNYGAVLQAYALKSVCCSLGYEAHVVDYALKSDEGPHPILSFCRSRHRPKDFIHFAKALLSYPWDRMRWKAVKRFRESFLDETAPCVNTEELLELGFDCFVMGSDQIWNYHITGERFDPVFFGILSEKVRCVVYAASAHDTPFPADKEIELQRMLSKTGASISVREKKLAEYTDYLTECLFPVVLDPTLLAGKQVMETVETSVKIREPYILLYQIDSNPASNVSIRSLERTFGRRVYSMTVPKIGSLHGKKGGFGPGEFMALLDHADFVVTNSFHGVALSLLWHKLFFVYVNGGVMTRIDNLLDIVQVKDRKITMVSDIDLKKSIDYDRVDAILAEERAKSLDFLQTALKRNVEADSCAVSKKRLLPAPFEKRKKNACSGCAACVEICASGAISMKPDQEGFLYPSIAPSSCIHCGSCDRFCSFLPEPRRNYDQLPSAYGVKHRDLSVRKNSRSGGAFVAISDWILNQNGVVYGAVQDDGGAVRHTRAETTQERDRMQGAKYVQSDLRGVLQQLMQDLLEGRKVLFSGTPCQVAGVRELLRAKRTSNENLITCDLVCHGAPSPRIWSDYRAYIQEKYRSGIVKADFRDKSFGWDSHCESFVLENGKKIVSRDYTDLFYEHLMFRPSCHSCHFSNLNRVSDITLGDFWGIEKNAPQLEDQYGVSLVLVNTAKGHEIIEAVRNELEMVSCDVLNCLQPTLVKPSEASPLREQFWQSYRENGFELTLKRFSRPKSTSKRIKRSLKQMMYIVHLRKHP